MRILLYVCRLAMLGLAALGAHAATVGVILDVQGAAALVEGGKSTRLDILMPLPSGSKVVLEDKARATLVLYRNNATYELAGPAAVSVGDDGLKAVRGAAPQPKNISQQHAAVAVEGINRRLAMSAVVLRGIAGVQPVLQLTSPSQDAALVSSEPELAWQLGRDAAAREVVIQEMTGQEVARYAVREDRLVVPRSAGLKPGAEYVWSVTARFPDGGNETRERVFRILGAADIGVIESLRPGADADASAWVLFAAALEKFGAADEARKAWRVVAQKNPESQRARLIGE
jgi:hypothetical protein